jgi:hypothetical protein
MKSVKEGILDPQLLSFTDEARFYLNIYIKTCKITDSDPQKILEFSMKCHFMIWKLVFACGISAR